MDLDDLLQRYFGTTDLTDASPAVRAAGVERLRLSLAEFNLIGGGGSRCGRCSIS